MSLNKVILMGNMCADPELKATPSGTSVCSFNIAVNRRFNKEEVDFITIVAWKQTAEFICKYFGKGQAMLVCGSLQTRNWTDNQGVKRYATEVVADEVSFAGSKESDGGQSRTPVPTKPYVPSAYTQYPTDNFASTQNSQNFEEIPSNEGLPFLRSDT